MKRKVTSRGTANVPLDLGFEDAEYLSAKAAITGMTQPKVSQVRRYKLQNFLRSA